MRCAETCILPFWSGCQRTVSLFDRFTSAGVTLYEERPPAELYRLNREHLAGEAIGALTDLWGRWVEKMRGGP